MMPLVFDPELVEAEERRVVAETMAGWADKYPDVQVTTSVLRGHPVRALTSAATYASLLVVGSRGRGALASTRPRVGQPRRPAPRHQPGAGGPARS